MASVQTTLFDSFKTLCDNTLLATDKGIVSKCLSGLLTAYKNKVIKVLSPSGLIGLHEKIITISKCLFSRGPTDTLCQEWKKVLGELHNRKVITIGIGPSKFDTSIAVKVIDAQALPKITFQELNKNDKQAVEDAVSEMAKAEEWAFGTFLPEGFIKPLLTSLESKCILAKDENQKIVGFVWGFNLNVENRKVFHTFAMARKVEFAKLGIGNSLSDEGIKTIDASKAHAISLNVLSQNHRALGLYRKLGFQSKVSEDDQKKLPKDVKIFMFKTLRQNTNSVDAKATGKAMTTYIINTLGYIRLALLELIRRLVILWKRIYYSNLFVR